MVRLEESNNSNNSSSKQNNNFKPTVEQAAQENQTPPCKICGKATVKRSFKSKEGTEGYFFGCSAWQRDGKGCNAQPIWIN